MRLWRALELLQAGGEVAAAELVAVIREHPLELPAGELPAGELQLFSDALGKL
jgi:hypothetical protein